MKTHPHYTEGLYLEKSSVETDYLKELKKSSQLKHFTRRDWDFVAGAHDLMTRAHNQENKPRYSKLPYRTHPEGSVWIYLLEIIQDGSSPSAMDIATILCHDVIEDCPRFREELYAYSPELFWKVASQSEIAKSEVCTYLTQKKTEERVQELINPSWAYLVRLSSDVNVLMGRCGNIMNHIFFDPQFMSGFPLDQKHQLIATQIATYSFDEIEKKSSDRIYNLRDRLHLPEKRVPGFMNTIYTTRRLLVPHCEWLHMDHLRDLLLMEANNAGSFIGQRKLHKP